MPLLRRIGLLLAMVLGAAVLTSPAFGARPTDVEYPFKLGTTHFLVHYDPAATTLTEAGDLAALAERAYAAELADGYSGPMSDGVLGDDGRTDVYIGGAGALGVTIPDDDAALKTSSFIMVDDPGQETIAHELFHAIQLSIWQPQSVFDYWALEASAKWMGYRVDSYNIGGDTSIGPPDMPLDCRNPGGTIWCDPDPYSGNGYSRWSFFEYVAERYGVSWVKDLFAQGAAGAPNMTAALQAYLATKGTNLSDLYNDWIVVDMRGGYTLPALQGLAPIIYGSPTLTGVGEKLDNGDRKADNLVLSKKVTVNHLSTRYLALVRGELGGEKNACYAATLSLEVKIPAGVTSRPVFWWDQEGSLPVSLAVSGNTATATVPWDTCTYEDSAGFLALPNGSTNVDAADFDVTANMHINFDELATAVEPPKPVSVNTPVVPVSGSELVPKISVFGPDLLRLDAGDTQVRMIVESNGPGRLQARLGSLTLGTVKIRGGNNDVRFTLPAGAVASLRTSSSSSGVLTLTPVASTGSAAGTAILQKIRLAPAGKVVAKPKPKLKTKAKAKTKTKTVKKAKGRK